MKEYSHIKKFSRWQSFFGVWDMLRNPVDSFKHYLDQSKGSTYSFYFGGLKKVIVTSNPKIIRHILYENAANYHKSEIQVKKMGFFLGKGLLTSHGDEWLNRRRLIQKGFHKNRLSTAVAIMQEEFNSSIRQLEVGHSTDPTDISQFMMRLTFSMVTKSLFSISLPDRELNFISNSILAIQRYMVKQIVQPYLNPWRAISGSLEKHTALRDKADAILMSYIQQRRQSIEKKDDILQLFLDARDADTGSILPDNEVLHEIMQLLVAGHETSSNALSWIFYLLCRHPEPLSKLTAEINEVLDRKSFEYEDITSLKYSKQVINEALRLYPPFWMVDRVAVEEDQSEGISIKAGSTIIAFIYGTHHDENIWSDHLQFRPERFAPENLTETALHSFIPFGVGPRSCIGSNFAILQMLLILTSMVKNFRMELVPDAPVETAPLLILRPKNGIHIKFSKKDNTRN